MDRTADVVVIGGGIMGTATAYHLAKRGIAVSLLEKTQLAAGSTGLTCGVVRQFYSIETLARMAFRAREIWEHFDELIGGEVGFRKSGILWVAGEKDEQSVRSTTQMMQSIGINIDLLDPEDVKELAPYLETQDLRVGAYEPDGGVADGSMACTAFAARARELGAIVKQGVEVTKIRVKNGQVVGVETTDGPIDTPVVVNTAGPWGPKIMETLGIKIQAEPSRHQVISFKQPEDFLKPLHPAIADFVNAFYTRSDVGGLTNVGSLEDDTSDVVHNPDSYNSKSDRSFELEMAERSSRRIPDLNRGWVKSGWAGIYTVTPDWKPIIDKIDSLTGLVVGLGFSGSGFKMGPVVGEMLADLATGEKQCPIDSSLFRWDRFDEGGEIKGDFDESIIG